MKTLMLKGAQHFLFFKILLSYNVNFRRVIAPLLKSWEACPPAPPPLSPPSYAYCLSCLSVAVAWCFLKASSCLLPGAR